MRCIGMLVNIGWDIHAITALQGSTGLENTYLQYVGGGRDVATLRTMSGAERGTARGRQSHPSTGAGRVWHSALSYVFEWKYLMPVYDVLSNTGNFQTLQTHFRICHNT